MNLGIETETLEFKMLKSGFVVCFYRSEEKADKKPIKAEHEGEEKWLFRPFPIQNHNNRTLYYFHIQSQ